MRLVFSTVTALTLVACVGGHGGEGGTDGSGGGTADSGDPCAQASLAPRRLEVNPRGLQCEAPDRCVSLPEAVDRELVALSSGSTGLVIENIDEDADVCMDGWYLFMSEDSQDAGAGEPDDDEDDSSTGDTGEDDGDDGDDADDDDDDDGDDDPCDDTEPPPPSPGAHIRVAPSQALTFNYGGRGAGLDAAPTWWCVEETQVTASTDTWTFTGARLPQPLAELAVQETDLDGDGVEDHVDAYGSTMQTNKNIWDFQRNNAVFSVGRDRSFVELTDGGEETVTLEVTNMGKVAGSVHLTETLPPGVEASSFSTRPTEIEVTPLGWTVLHWDRDIDASIDTASNVHTDYAIFHVTYTVSMKDGAACPLRHEGRAPTVTWQTEDVRRWTSTGTGLVVSCCAR